MPRQRTNVTILVRFLCTFQMINLLHVHLTYASSPFSLFTTFVIRHSIALPITHTAELSDSLTVFQIYLTSSDFCISLFFMHASASETFGAGGILFSDESVREWLRESVRPENLANTVFQAMTEFHPILIIDVFWFIHRCADYILGSKVKVTAGGGITVDSSRSSSI